MSLSADLLIGAEYTRIHSHDLFSSILSLRGQTVYQIPLKQAITSCFMCPKLHSLHPAVVLSSVTSLSPHPSLNELRN